MSTELLSYRKLTQLTGLSRSALIRRVRTGKMPAPVQVGSKRRVRFFADEIEEWLRSRPRARYTRQRGTR